LLQTLLGRQGWLDRVDVVAAEEAGLQEVMDRISERIGGVASVRRAAARDEWVDRTMATVRTITFSLAAIETIVAALLVFGTMSLAVDRRARELALLRSVGFEPGRARRLVHVDALVVGLLAILAGFPLGVALSRVFLPLLSRVSAYLQDVHIEPGAVSAVTTGVAILVGLLVAQVGTYLPALRTAEASPLVVMRGEQRGREVLWPGAAWWIASLVLGAGWLALGTSSFGLPPLVRVGLIFAIGVAFLASASVRILPPLLRAGRGLLERVIPRVGRLAGASLASRARDSGVTMAAVSGVLAGLTTVLVMVESLAWTLDHWIATEYRNAVLVTAGSPFAGRDRELVRHETTRTVRDVEGVRAVSELFTANILYRGEEVLLVGQSAAVLERYGELPAIGSSPAELARALKRGETAVSDAFADHFGVKAGQSITLYTPKGPRTLRVAGYFRDYVGPAGSIQVDIGVLDELWPREGSYLLAVWVDSPASSAIERIREAIGDRQELFFIHGADLDHYAGNVLRQLTHLMTQVAFLTALLGGIAVTNLLVAAVTERRREILLIRSAGATNGQLTTLVLVDAALLALPGAGVGIAVGLACAYPMVTDVLREAFGWSVTFRVAPLKIVTLFAEVIAAAVLAGLYPAWLGRHLLPRDAFAPE
jgi:putative ABC transport system permease protein